MKKIVSVLMSLIMVFTVIPIAGISAGAEDAEASPSYVMFQANEYASKFQDIFGDASSSYANNFFTNMDNDSSVKNSIIAWEALHIATSPSHTLESGWISKKNMYKLAIFDMLDVTKSNELADTVFKTITDSRNSYVCKVTSTVLDESDIDVRELKNCEITAEYVNTLKIGATAAKAADVASVIIDIVDATQNLYEAINAIASYQAISDMKNGTLSILSAIAKDESNPMDLRAAAGECVVYFNDAYDEALSNILSGVNIVGETAFISVAKFAIDTAWSAIVSAIPGGAAVLIGAKGIRVLGNAVFKLDDVNKSYYQLESVVIMENAIRSIMNKMNCNYLNDSNLVNAIKYMRSVEMYKQIVLLGFKYSVDLLEVKANSWGVQAFDWLTGNYNEFMNLIDDINEMKENKIISYKRFEEMVLNLYTAMYFPTYDEFLNDFENQNKVKIESITITQTKEININDKGCISKYISIDYEPKTAEAPGYKDIISKDESILKVDKLYNFEAVGAGECTLVFDEAGEFETEFTVTVGSEPNVDTPYDYLSDFKYEINSDGNTVTITGYTGSSQRVIIPGEIEGKKVQSIGDYAFSRCKSLTSITIPDSVTSIGDEAFEDCESLTSVTIPDSVTSIGDYAFCYCTSLTSITIPDSVTSIGDYAFSWCESLTSVTIPNSVTSIGDGAFSRCKSLTSITIPDSVTSIGDRAFSYCTSLTSITIPDSVTSIGGYAFRSCTSLTSITIPDSVTSIGDDAFHSCESLTSVTIGNSVTSIGYWAFEGCTSLTSVTIPDSVTSIDYKAFYNCTSLKDVYYNGTQEQWSKISIGSYNAALNNATIHFNSEYEEPSTDPTEPTNPSIPTDPISPTNPVNPTEPTNPTDPIISTQPTTLDPTEQTSESPSSPIEPTEPSTSNISTQPTTSSQSVTNSTATQPTTAKPTVKPTGSTTVTQPTKTTTKSANQVYTKPIGPKPAVNSTTKATTTTANVENVTVKAPKLTAGKKQFKVQYKKVKNASGFQVRYKTGKGKWKLKTFNTEKSASKVIKGLKKGKYKVQIRAFAKNGSKKSYSKWSKTKTVKVK